jgi:hypothetical protein
MMVSGFLYPADRLCASEQIRWNNRWRVRLMRWLTGTLLYAVMILTTFGSIYAAQPRRTKVKLGQVRALKLERHGEFQDISVGNFTTHSYSREIKLSDARGGLEFTSSPTLPVTRINVTRASGRKYGSTVERGFVEAYESEGRRLIMWIDDGNDIWNYKIRVDFLVGGYTGIQQLRVDGLLSSQESRIRDGTALGDLLKRAGAIGSTSTLIDRVGYEGVGGDRGYRYDWNGTLDFEKLGVQPKVTLGDVIATGLIETLVLTTSEEPADYVSVELGSVGALGGARLDGIVARDNAPLILLSQALAVLLAAQFFLALLAALRVVRCGKYLELAVINELCGVHCRQTLYGLGILSRKVGLHWPETAPGVQGIGHVGLFRTGSQAVADFDVGVPTLMCWPLVRNEMHVGDYVNNISEWRGEWEWKGLREVQPAADEAGYVTELPPTTPRKAGMLGGYRDHSNSVRGQKLE